MNGNKRHTIAHNPNVVCDVCGRKRKWSEVIHAYGSGMIATVISCRDGCADVLHPLNFPPPVIFDGQPIPDARPEQTDVFIVNTGLTAPVTWGTNAYTYGPTTVSEFSTDMPNNDNIPWNLI